MTTLGFSGRVRRTRYQISAGAYAPVAPALTAALSLVDIHYSEFVTFLSKALIGKFKVTTYSAFH